MEGLFLSFEHSPSPFSSCCFTNIENGKKDFWRSQGKIFTVRKKTELSLFLWVCVCACEKERERERVRERGDVSRLKSSKDWDSPKKRGQFGVIKKTSLYVCKQRSAFISKILMSQSFLRMVAKNFRNWSIYFNPVMHNSNPVWVKKLHNLKNLLKFAFIYVYKSDIQFYMMAKIWSFVGPNFASGPV